MPSDFLIKFMNVARQNTGADRFMAIDDTLTAQEMINVTPEVATSPDFSRIAQQSVYQALESGEPVITNNVITDPSQAPVTNTNFSDLRVIVVIPVPNHGALYLDQHIRKGVIPRETIEQLAHFARHVVAHGLTDVSQDELFSLYESMYQKG